MLLRAVKVMLMVMGMRFIAMSYMEFHYLNPISLIHLILLSITLMSSASGRLELKCQQAIYPQPLGGPPGPRLSTNDFSLEVFLEIECTSTLARAQTSTYRFNIDIYLSDIYIILRLTATGGTCVIQANYSHIEFLLARYSRHMLCKIGARVSCH